MEDVCSVFMNVDAFSVFAKYIAAELRSFVNNEATLACLMSHIGESGSK